MEEINSEARFGVLFRILWQWVGEMRELKDSIKLGLNWITGSDIRIRDLDHQSTCGICQGYNWKQGSYPYIYTEITGYGVSSFVNYFRWTGEQSYLDIAQNCAQYLIYVQDLVSEEENYGALPHSLSVTDFKPLHQYFSFDSAMCLQGLLDLNDISPSDDLLRTAKGIGNWLVNKMQRSDGSFTALHDQENVGVESLPDKVFGDGGCLHAKHAIGLLKLGKSTQEETYNQSARLVCDWVLSLQDEDGSFRTSTQSDQVVSHTCCYATEGLLFACNQLKEEKYLDAARKASKWLLKNQNRDGSISIAYKGDWRKMGRQVTEKIFPRKVSDATAQAIRIWIFFYYLDADDLYLDAIFKASRFLLQLQVTKTTDLNALGAFLFEPGHSMMYTWSTMFSIHALYALDNIGRSNGDQHMIEELF
jgi:hypothetical protein